MSERIQRWAVIGFILYIALIGGTLLSTFFVIPAAIFQVVVTIILIYWLITLFRERRPWPKTRLDAPLAAYTIWLLVTTFAAIDVRVSLEAIWRFLVHIAGFYLLVDMMRKGRQRWVMEALALSGGAIIAISIAEMFSWYFGLGLGGLEHGWFAVDGLGEPIPPNIHRLSVALNNSTMLSNYVALLLPVMLAWALTTRQADYRIGLLLVCAGLLWVEIFSFSRGGWLATLAAAGTLLLFWLYRWSVRSERYSPRVVMPLAIGGFVAATIGAMALIAAVRGVNIIDQDEGRLDMWNSAIEMTAERPLTGFGVAQFGAGSREYRDPSISDNQLAAAHNVVLNVGAETGLPGVGLLIWLSAVFIWVWWQEWQASPPARRIRLEGILAALVGLGAHSLVDAFSLTASVLPILVFAAYTLAGRFTPDNPSPEMAPQEYYYWLRPAAAALVIAYFGWLLVINYANLQLVQSIAAIANDDLDTALEKAERAQEYDPYLGLYDLHQAYVLGLLADDAPETYLDRAIEAHEEALDDYPTFDTGHANLAALYHQRGNYDQAIRHMRQARDNNTYKAIYHVMLGQYLEERAIARGNDPLESGAVESYRRALEEELALAQSAFWDPDPSHSARQAGLTAFFEDADPGEQLLIAVYRGWEMRAAGVLDANTDSDEYLAALALGTYFRDMVGDYEAAREWFNTAIERKPQAVAYAERAETYYLLGDMANAETDARIALYHDPVLAARAYYILALVELDAGDVAPDDEQFNDWLIKGVEPRIVKEDFSQVVFLRPGFFDYLPQMNAPGRDSDHYAPWLLLAERYAADDDPETDAADVYEAILRQDPYVEAAQERLATLR